MARGARRSTPSRVHAAGGRLDQGRHPRAVGDGARWRGRSAARGDDEAIKLAEAGRAPPGAGRRRGRRAGRRSRSRVCPLVKAWFDSDELGRPSARPPWRWPPPANPACVPGPDQAARQHQGAPRGARRGGRRARRPIDDPDGARRRSATAAKDDQPDRPVRAAAMLALISPGAGRPQGDRHGDATCAIRPPSCGRRRRRASCARAATRTWPTSTCCSRTTTPRPALAALRELERVPTDESTKLIARLAQRPQLAVQKAGGRLLLARAARATSYAALQAVPRAEAPIPTLRGRGAGRAPTTPRCRPRPPTRRWASGLPRAPRPRRARSGGRLVPRLRHQAAARRAGRRDDRLA